MKHPGRLADTGTVWAGRSVSKGSSLSLILEKNQSKIQVEVGSVGGVRPRKRKCSMVPDN